MLIEEKETEKLINEIEVIHRIIDMNVKVASNDEFIRCVPCMVLADEEKEIYLCKTDMQLTKQANYNQYHGTYTNDKIIIT